MYLVDLLPEQTPDFFRSGMNASIDFMANSKSNILLLPNEAVTKEGSKAYVLVKDGQPLKREVELGASDDKNVEIVSGLSPEDIVLVKTKKYMLPTNNVGTNPFLPRRRESQSQRR